MPRVRNGEVELAWFERGTGDRTVVLSPSYLVDHRHFEPQIAALEGRYRVVAYDHRDHGESSRAPGPYGLDDIVADAVAVIEASGAAPCHFVGLSTGGFVGLRLALRHRQLLRSLVLMDTSAEREALARRVKYEAMFAVLRLFGTRPLQRAAMRAMFGRSVLADPARADELDLWRQRIAAGDPSGLIRFGRAIFHRDGVLGELGSIDVPALVLVGEEDRSTPPFRARRLAAALPGARLETIPRAGHLSTLDNPAAVNAALAAFLDARP